MLDWLIKKTVTNTVREELPKHLDRLVPEIIRGVFQEADDEAVPRTRHLFIWAIDAELQKYGMGGEPGLKHAQEVLADWEENTAPWGDPDYHWDVKAVREWVSDLMEDR